jgi:hypothetical protein
MPERPPSAALILESPEPRHPLVALSLVWGTWAVMTLIGAVIVTLRFPGHTEGTYVNITLLAAAAAAMTIGIRRARHITRIADAFFSLVLLNPALYTPHLDPLNGTLMGTALLGLMAGAILAMKRDHFLRYLAVTVLALLLSAVGDTFIMLLPAMVAWMLFAGYQLARVPPSSLSVEPPHRTRGFLIMALGEILLVVFGLACVLIEPTRSPSPATLFSHIVSFADFPLLVLAIIMLALGWHKGPHHTTPPYFAGTLALLLGLLTMLLNNFQSGTLPPPGADQTTLVLCLVYAVFALHGPKRLQWLVPPVLLIIAVLSTLFH